MTPLDEFFEQRIADVRDVHMVCLGDDPLAVYEAVAFRSAGVDIVVLPTLDERGVTLDMHVFVDGDEAEGSPRSVAVIRNA